MPKAFDPTPGLALLRRWLDRQETAPLVSRLAAVADAFDSDRAGWTPPPPAPHVWASRDGRLADPLDGPCLVAGPLRVATPPDRLPPAASQLLGCFAPILATTNGRVPTPPEPPHESESLAQRLHDASLIVGRAAHDFDNILQGVLGFADLTMPLLQPDSAEGAYLAEMLKVADRGLRLTRQMHQLSRGGTRRPRPTFLASVLAEEERRFRDGLPANVTLTVAIPPALPTVAMDADPLRQVIGTLLDNAREALPPTGGTVSVAVRQARWDGLEDGWFGANSPGVGPEIAVEDNGAGVPPDVRRRLFAEPFFTTKVRHSGLGLAVAYRILYAHGGSLRLESDTGSGTRVRVRIPATPT